MNLDEKLRGLIHDSHVRLCIHKEGQLLAYDKFNRSLENSMVGTKLAIFNHYMFNPIQAYNIYFNYLTVGIDLLRNQYLFKE